MQLLQKLRFCALAGALALTACHTAKPRPDHPRIAPGVRLQDVTFHSAALNRDMPYRVYLPEQIPPGRKLPVVYLLHGGDGGFRDWSNNSDVGTYAAKGMILVMIEGAFSYYMNAAERPSDRYEDYFLHDLISDVQNRFPASTERSDRAIVGISMGGFAALKFAMANPEMFYFVAALSPPVDILHRPFRLQRWGEWSRIRTIFGPSESASRQSRDPIRLVQAADPARTPYIYLSVGQSEALYGPVRHFSALLDQRHLPHEFHSRPGGHDWGQWNSQLSGCFAALLHPLN
ncbi:MAG TPA: alpha/beta hydrolase-fold protein [Terracidiphilus sp.]|jgi:S-formylglutathione hydrolase FrmB|nr:alpha/beta hydrolase-fold protein [Terracidiphilus sp.]